MTAVEITFAGRGGVEGMYTEYADDVARAAVLEAGGTIVDAANPHLPCGCPETVAHVASLLGVIYQAGCTEHRRWWRAVSGDDPAMWIGLVEVAW